MSRRRDYYLYQSLMASGGGAATPVNTVAPSIAVQGGGEAGVGSVLEVTPGTWTNTPTLTYQWYKYGTAIGSATGTTYTVLSGDLPSYITVKEIPNGVTASQVQSNFLWVDNVYSLVHVGYSFVDLVGANGATISNGNAGLNDLSPNNLDATVLNSPQILEYTLNFAAKKTLRDLLTQAVSTGSTGAFLNSSFEFHMFVQMGDGLPSANSTLFGALRDANSGINVQIRTDGKLRISFGNTTDGRFQWESTSNITANGTDVPTYMLGSLDFTADTFTLNTMRSGHVNSIAGSFIENNVATINPANWNNNQAIAVASLNNVGVIGTNPTANSFFKFFLTQSLTAAQRQLMLTECVDKLNPNVGGADINFLGEIRDTTSLADPHAIIYDDEAGIAIVSCKGSEAGESDSGSIAFVDFVTHPYTPTILGYLDGANQTNGETVIKVATNRVIHFTAINARMIGYANTASPSITKSVAYSGDNSDIINGACKIGNYVFGAAKGGSIEVFLVSDPDNFTLAGSYNTAAVGGGNAMSAPHDVWSWGDYIVIANNTADGLIGEPAVALIQVMSGGNLIPVVSWTAIYQRFDVGACNRIKVMNDFAICMNSNIGDPKVHTLDLTDNLSEMDQISIEVGTANVRAVGVSMRSIQNRYWGIACGSGFHIMDFIDPYNLSIPHTYYNRLRFGSSTSDSAIHDFDFYDSGDGLVMAIAGSQNDNNRKVCVWSLEI